MTADTLKRLGDTLNRRQDVIRSIQSALVAVYLALLVGPVLDGAPPGLARLAEAVFWGVWWPGVILSVLVFGQFWCGLLCPDGTVTEFASRHGKGWKVPAWMRRAALPLAGFAAITLAGDLTGAHRSAAGTLILVGGASLAGAVTGLFYGRGKRVWCRYLCPTGGIFSILARASALHYKVDRAAWDAAARPVPKPVDCPPLLDVRRLTSNEKCNMCGRCSGHRGAVALAYRPPGSEIASLRDDEVRNWEALGICFVLIGLAWAGIHGRAGIVPGLEGWPSVLAVAFGLGGATLALLVAAAGRIRSALRLAYGLIPMGGMCLLLGALEHSLSLLAREGLDAAPALPWLRAGFLAVGAIWSARLGWHLLAAPELPRWHRGAGFSLYLALLGLLALCTQFAPASLRG